MDLDFKHGIRLEYKGLYYNEFKITKSLNELKEMLGDKFIQTHRACFVNKDRVIKIDKIRRIIYFDNGVKTDLLSTKYRKELSVV